MAESTDEPYTSSPIVEFKDMALGVKERLMANKEQLDVISIVGMAGLGKTTLALKVYNDDAIAYHFYIRAWIYVSQTYEKRDLLLEILSSPYIEFEANGDIHKMSDEKLGEVLYKRLKGNRYLIVMDDMWSIKAWDDMKRYFPNDNNGSRVVFTSRIRDLADSTVPYELQFLSEQESWELLQEKIFHRETSFPLELIEVGKEIAKKCQGLPLSIVVIGGLLAKIEKEECRWKQVEESMGSYIASDPEQCTEALELSYIYLPNHLKPLFLYVGAFPEDYEIPVFKLIWLWIAEGFVKKIWDEILEDTALDYLIDLIGRSLILVSKRSSNGEVKSCRIHDLLRDLCLRKAKEENFMQIINRYEKVSPILRSSSSSNLVANKARRLSINSLVPDNFPFDRSPKTRSILIHRTYWGPRKSFSLQHLKLLKVLDLKDVQHKFIPTEIEQLVHLRYLAFRWLSNELARSISNLQNLETLICLSQERKVFIKVDISNMIKLRHFHINPYAPLTLGNSSLLANLQTISTPNFIDGDFGSLKSTPNLRELRCIFSNSGTFPRSACACTLEFLVKLETLWMDYRDHQLFRLRGLHLPASLKKITLSNFRFDWKVISKLARLPKLEVLKLQCNAVNGTRWDTSFEESNLHFPKLKFMKFESLNIVEWNTSRDHFPSLQRLVLNKCKQLKEIPSDIGDIPTLQTIELNRCSCSAAKSVRQILEEQKEMGNEQLKISIYPPDISSTNKE